MNRSGVANEHPDKEHDKDLSVMDTKVYIKQGELIMGVIRRRSPRTALLRSALLPAGCPADRWATSAEGRAQKYPVWVRLAEHYPGNGPR